MKNNKFWEARVIFKDNLLEKYIKKIKNKTSKLFKNAKKQILNELKIFYIDIKATEYIKYQTESTLTRINSIIDTLYKNNKKNITEAFTELYEVMDIEASKEIGANFNAINQTKVNEVIEDNWAGLTLSERIEEHKRKLNLSIKEEILKGIKRGDSLQNISRIIADRFDISYANTMRLVRTEASRVMNEATLNNYKENGIKKYEYMAYLDNKTSKQCKGLDGKVFNVENAKAGVNLPPMHPNCRSTIIPYIKQQ
jgi:SPP1 gp7 family putative phage head morphogenesis protein